MVIYISRDMLSHVYNMYIYIYTHTYSPHIFHPLFVLHGKTPYQYQLGSSHTGVPHSTSLNAQRLAVTLRHCVHVVQPHVKAAAIPGARKAAATIVVTAATPEIEGMSQQPMGNMSIYSLYIPGNPKASFFSIVRGWHVFCHYGCVGSIEGPIWRTKIRSVN